MEWRGRWEDGKMGRREEDREEVRKRKKEEEVQGLGNLKKLVG